VADAALGLTRLLAAARDGDEQAFVQLTSPHRRALHVHAYRMLGNLNDADDALQETLLRAWRGLPGYQPRAALSTWMHRIATNVALRMLEQRKPVEPLDAHLQPYPDRLIDELPTPEEQAIARERLGLAYVAAMQLLPARQRTVLALREGLGWSARETAEALELSTVAVNSALQRARDRLAREPEALARAHDASAEAPVIEAFLRAWADVDVPRIIALLSDDVLLTMPPMGLRYEGVAAVGEFFATQPMDGRLDRISHVVTRANGQPALASYAGQDAYGVMVIAIRGNRIAGFTGFPRDLDLFAQLGLPARCGRLPNRGSVPPA
jgi:RNA polymerase sigma-70 factor, ECF subfamily